MIDGGCRPVGNVESGDAAKMSRVVRHKCAPVSDGGGGNHHVHVADRGAGLFKSSADFGVGSRAIFVPRYGRSKFEEKRDGVQNAFGALFASPEEEFRRGDGGDADFGGMALDMDAKVFVAATDCETARVRIEHEGTGFHVKFGSGRVFWEAVRSSAKSGTVNFSKNSFQVRRPVGVSTSESPLRRTKTSDTSKRNWRGMRTACERPVMKTFAVVICNAPIG